MKRHEESRAFNLSGAVSSCKGEDPQSHCEKSSSLDHAAKLERTTKISKLIDRMWGHPRGPRKALSPVFASR